MHHPKPRSQGFTLIELLVVIAIIAILAAILFPVFSTVRARARAITGLSNCKQMALAINMYSNDYDTTFPRSGWTDHKGNIKHNGPGQWSDVVGPYVRSGGVVTDIADSSKYTGGPLPLDPVNGLHSLLINDLLSHDPDSTNINAFGDANWNGNGSDTSPETLQRAKGENTIVAPADCVLLMEGHCPWQNSGKSYDGFDSGTGDNKFWGENNISQYDPANITGTTYGGWHFIDGLPMHNQRAGTNAAFVDGHAKYYRVSDGNGNNTIATTLPFRKNIDPTQAGMGNGDWQTRGLSGNDNWQ